MRNLIKTTDVTSLASADYLRAALDTTDNKVYYLKSGETIMSSNQIWYTTTDNSTFTITDLSAMGLTYNGPVVSSNVYANNKGIMTFDSDITALGVYVDGNGNPTGYTVFFATTITGEGAENNKLSTVSLPQSVETINPYAFIYCANLSSVTMPAVKRIEGQAFYSCTSLTSVTLPDDLEYLGTLAFGECTALTSVIYKNVTYTSKTELKSAFDANGVDYGDIGNRFYHSALTD